MSRQVVCPVACNSGTKAVPTRPVEPVMRIFTLHALLGREPRRAALAAHLPTGYNFRMIQASETVRVKVLFFGRLRELAGLGEEMNTVPGNATISDIFESYEQRHPKLWEFRRSVVASRNQEFAPWDSHVADGDEIAFLPPVSGG